LADDIEETLLDAGVEHILEVMRSRIFLETDQLEEAGKVLERIPGIYSFSVVEPSSSEKAELMGALSRYGKTRIEKGMTYGLKVRRTGTHPYTSQDIAIDGGGAVISHLEEDDTKVDLKDPDVWIEVEIRDARAYLFENRIKGLGGMPASSQGKVLLYLPHPDEEIVKRSILSFILMRRRGCKVIPAADEEDVERWSQEMRSYSIGGGREPFILHGEDLEGKLRDALQKLKCRGLVVPSGPGEETKFPVMHSKGASVSQFYPTISMSLEDVEDWISTLNG
jgi:thiamine biosynthesis protein ThiI